MEEEAGVFQLLEREESLINQNSCPLPPLPPNPPGSARKLQKRSWQKITYFFPGGRKRANEGHSNLQFIKKEKVNSFV
jgi:hypothetical protein